jgi:hypothetical protein
MKTPVKSVTRKAANLGLDILPDNKTHLNRMHVRSESSNRLYVVSQRKTSGQWECKCPAWVLTFPRKNCKHLNAILPELAKVCRAMTM